MYSKRLRSRLGSWAAALAIGFSATLAGSADAQFGAKDAFSNAFVEDYLSRDMPLFVEALELEDWQMPIVESLLEQYAADFKTGVEGVRDQIREKKQEITESGDTARVMEAVMKPIESWMGEKARLKEEFLANVKAQLSEAQLLRWPKFEMTFRREKTLDKGALSGESVNIFGIVREMQLDPSILEIIGPALDQYEAELDTALLAREREIEATKEELTEAMKSNDTAAGLRLIDRIMTKRVAIRGVQERSAESISAVLPEPYNAEFKKRFNERAYSKVYRAPVLERVFEVAKKLEDLTEDQLTAVVQLEGNYVAENGMINESIVTALKQSEPLEQRRKVELQAARKGGNAAAASEDPVVKAFAQRDALTTRTLDQLKAILTPEQFAKLPKIAAPREKTQAKDRKKKLDTLKARKAELARAKPRGSAPAAPNLNARVGYGRAAGPGGMASIGGVDGRNAQGNKAKSRSNPASKGMLGARESGGEGKGDGKGKPKGKGGQGGGGAGGTGG